MSAHGWPRLPGPTPIDHLISSLNYTAARMRHVQTGPSKGLFQFIPSRFQKGAPTMDASQKHHSDILDTLSDYLTRPEVTKITLDRDDATDTWDITATVEVDPALEARKLEDEMMEAVTMTSGAVIPDRSSTLIGTEFGTPSGPSDSMAVEFTDRDGETWGLCWDGKLRLLDDYACLGPRKMSEVVDKFGPFTPKTRVSRARVDAARPAEGPTINVTSLDAGALDFLNYPILESKVAAGLDTFTMDTWPGDDPETIIVLTATDSDGDEWYRTWGGMWRMRHAISRTFTKTPYPWSQLSEKFGPFTPKVLADATRVAFLKSVKRGEAKK